MNEITMWEMENMSRIVKWEKDFENKTITFWLDDIKTGEQKLFHYE